MLRLRFLLRWELLMTIYDRARHELSKPDKRTEWGRVNRPEHEDAMLYFAAEVVRLHDQLTALVDELEAEAKELGRYDGGPEFEEAAARIRAVIERIGE